MESLLIGSFHRPSIPVAAEFSPLKTSSHAIVRVLKCKAWKRPEKHYSTSMKLQRQYITQEHVGGSDLSIISADKKLKERFLVHASSEHPLESQPSKSPWDSVHDAADAFYRFSRPHTIIGTALSIISVSLLAVEKFSDFSPLFFTGVFEAIVAALFMNIYIVGLNQLSDIEIDKVNKPYLPLASGEYSMQTGVIVVASFAILSFWLGWMVGSWPLFWALFISFVLGTAYSINNMIKWPFISRQILCFMRGLSTLRLIVTLSEKRYSQEILLQNLCSQMINLQISSLSPLPIFVLITFVTS